jgi:hypothetical protein
MRRQHWHQSESLGHAARTITTASGHFMRP